MSLWNVKRVVIVGIFTEEYFQLPHSAFNGLGGFPNIFGLGCRHSSVDPSAPTILPPGFESQANHLSFYFIYSQICAITVIVL